MPPHSWLFPVLSGIATGASWPCCYRALQLRPVSKVAPAIVFGLVFPGERPSWSWRIGGLLIMASAMVIALFLSPA